MAKVSINESTLTDIGDAIRAKTGGSALIDPADMADEIEAIPSGATLITKNITANGTYNASSDNADGYSSVSVNVPSDLAALFDKTITEITPEMVAGFTGTVFSTDWFQNNANLRTLSISDTVTNIYCNFTGTNIERLNLTNIDVLFTSNYNYNYRTIFQDNLGDIYVNGVKITDVAVPQTITNITQRCLWRSNITSFTAHNDVTIIGYMVCQFSPLININLGSGITAIGSNTFYNEVHSIVSVYCKAINPPSIGNTTFGAGAGFAEGGKIYVPAGSVEAYKTATNWARFADRIEGIAE